MDWEKTWEVLDVDTNYVFKNNFKKIGFFRCCRVQLSHFLCNMRTWLLLFINWTVDEKISNYYCMQIVRTVGHSTTMWTKFNHILGKYSMIYCHGNACIRFSQSFLHEPFLYSHDGNSLIRWNTKFAWGGKRKRDEQHNEYNAYSNENGIYIWYFICEDRCIVNTLGNLCPFRWNSFKMTGINF